MQKKIYMYYKSRKLSAARKRMKEQLTSLGWKEFECRFKLSGKVELHHKYNSPHIDDSVFWFENCLKNINPDSEAYYALESYSHRLIHVAWRCNFDNPNNHNPLDTLDAFEYVRELMLKGIDFNYYEGETPPEDRDPSEYSGHINIIDWEYPENNTFEFVEGWQGALNDGFGWDIILLVNAIPVGGIILEADDKESNLPPCQKALDVAQYQLNNDYQFPVYCHSLILSNGKQILYGDPWMELEDFTPIASLSEGLSPLDFLEHRIHTIEEIDY